MGAHVVKKENMQGTIYRLRDLILGDSVFLEVKGFYWDPWGKNDSGAKQNQTQRDPQIGPDPRPQINLSKMDSNLPPPFQGFRQ